MHFYDPKLHTWGAKVHKYFKCLINDLHADFLKPLFNIDLNQLEL